MLKGLSTQGTRGRASFPKPGVDALVVENVSDIAFQLVDALLVVLIIVVCPTDTTFLFDLLVKRVERYFILVRNEPGYLLSFPLLFSLSVDH